MQTGDGIESSREGPWGALAALAVAAAPALLAVVLAFLLPPLYDETYLVDPAYNHLAGGTAYPGVPYPVYVYWFFEGILKASFLVLRQGLGNAYLVCRLVNIGLYLAASVFFYLGLRRFFSRATALLGVFFLAWSPVSVLSVMFVKTEALQLCVITAALLSCGRVALGGASARQYALAGLLCGLLCLVKFNPMLALPYLAAVVAPYAGADPARANAAVLAGKVLRDEKAWLGGLLYLLCLALMFAARLDPSSAEAEGLAMTPYFNEFPSILRSMEGFTAFPFGRFSYPLLIFMPLFVGVAVYWGGLAGIFSRPLPHAFVAPWASFTCAFLLALFGLTLTRQPWVFTPTVPFFAGLAAVFFTSPGRRRGLSFIKKALAVPAVLLTIYQAALFPAMGYQLSSLVIKSAETRRDEGSGGELLVLWTNEKTSRMGVDASRLRRELDERRPEFLMVLSAYEKNFCRYPEKPFCRDACDFFGELSGGRTAYRLLWRKKIWYPLESLFSLDPGLSLDFSLYRDQREAGPPAPVRGAATWQADARAGAMTGKGSS